MVVVELREEIGGLRKYVVRASWWSEKCVNENIRC